MPTENASAMARRVYDRANDLATVAIKLTHHAANATGYADHQEPGDAIDSWRQMQRTAGEVQPALDELLKQLDEAIKETK